MDNMLDSWIMEGFGLNGCIVGEVGQKLGFLDLWGLYRFRQSVFGLHQDGVAIMGCFWVLYVVYVIIIGFIDFLLLLSDTRL